VNNAISYTRESAVKGKSTGYCETPYLVGKYRLKYLTNSLTVSPGQCKEYPSKIVSYKPQN